MSGNRLRPSQRQDAQTGRLVRAFRSMTDDQREQVLAIVEQIAAAPRARQLQEASYAR